MNDREWMREARCAFDPVIQAEQALGRDPFNDRDIYKATEVAKFCKQNSCPVIAECKAYALKYDLEGVWGGMTKKQRTYEKNQTLAKIELLLEQMKGLPPASSDHNAA